MFNPKTVETVIVKDTQSGPVFRKAGENSKWSSTEPGYLIPLRPGKKDSYEFLDFYEDMQEFLEDRYGLKKYSFMTYLFKIGSFEFKGKYTTNECNEPFLEVHANLPRKVLKDILWELSIECTTKHQFIMKAIVQPILSGPAAGKQRMEVWSNSGKRLGWIQPTYFDCAPILGVRTVFITQRCFGDYRISVASCLADAFKNLGISMEELDHSELPDGCYDEFCNKPYRSQKL